MATGLNDEVWRISWPTTTPASLSRARARECTFSGVNRLGPAASETGCDFPKISFKVSRGSSNPLDFFSPKGAGHSIGLHTSDPDRALQLGLTLPVCRVIVNQAHCFATGGSFDNALPFSLSMGCGTWGGNSISDNLNYRHFLNITRVVHPLPSGLAREPTDAEFFAGYRAKHGL